VLILYRIKELCIKLVIETSLHYDARSEKIKLHSVKVGEEIKLYLLIKDVVAISMSTPHIYPVIMLHYTYDYKIWSCE
jgi:hypothetical protein